MTEFVTYRFLKEGEELPSLQPGLIAEYWLAAEGLYLRAARIGLEVLMPLAGCPLPGLASLKPCFNLAYPLVPRFLLQLILQKARQFKSVEGFPLESLFYLGWDATKGEWWLAMPPQSRSTGAVCPLSAENQPGSSYTGALLEVHTHPTLPAFFSTADDRDERRGFRLYAVLGRIFDKPEIRVRVGVFGHFWEIAADRVFDLPPGLAICSESESAGEFDLQPEEKEVRLWPELT